SPIVLTPEMRSTGEVMGQDEDFGMAFAKTQMAAKPSLPLEGNVFLSVKDSDKPQALEIAKGLHDLGFSFYSTEGTAQFLNENGIKTETVLRISEGRPNVADLIKNGKIQLVINTPLGLIPRRDENGIRSEAVLHGIPVITTLGSAFATLQGIRSLKEKKFSVKSLQAYHP
ncbi:MAG: carbamoyl phosphate synthase large subunit, partial [Verrucomicrobiota bacterium]|nr:carbamoyl phosphate synthase large subunit [Verrucomicrobiota bacterium]